MFCVIQQVMRKKPDRFGEPLEIIAYQNQWRLDASKPFTWAWKYSEERYERPHLEAYKISIHSSCREGGVVKKRQYAVCTMSYYDVCETWWGDCVCGGEKAIADKLGIDPAEVCEIIGRKLDPLSERLTAEFRQSPEYIAKQEHERIRADYLEASSKFCSRYDVDKDDFARCYDIFLTLKNPEYLAQIKAQHKARKESGRRYRESWSSTYERYTSGSYSVPTVGTYGEDERAILKKFYRSLSKTYHPDLNPDEDTTEAMKLLNKLKEQWGV